MYIYIYWFFPRRPNQSNSRAHISMHIYAPSLRAHVLSEGRTSSSSSSSALSPQQQGNLWSSDAVAEGICFTSFSFEMNLKASVSRPHLLRWAWRHSFHFHIIWHICWDEREVIPRWTWRHPVFRDIFWNEHEGTRFTSIFVEMSRKAFVSLQYLLTWTWSHSFHFHIFWDVHEGIRFTPISFEENISSPSCRTRVLLFVIEWSVHIFYPSPSDVMLDPHFVEHVCFHLWLSDPYIFFTRSLVTWYWTPILLDTCVFICDWVIRTYFLPFP